MLKDDIKKVLISEEEIQNRVREMAARINEDYKDKNLLLVVILRGAVVFASDLLKNIDIYCNIDFMSVSSYGSGTESTGEVKIIKDLQGTIEGKDILIVEDILDTGKTLDSLIKMFKVKNPKSVEICTLVNKPERRTNDVYAKYIGFDIENEFIVGYGLDYNEKYRNLPFIGVLKEELYK